MRSGYTLRFISCCALLSLATACTDDSTGGTGGGNNGGFTDNNAPAPDMNQPDPTPDMNQPDPTPDMNQPDPTPDMMEPDPTPDMNEPDMNEPDMMEPDPTPDMMEPECLGAADCAEGELCVGSGCAEPWACQGGIECPEDGPEALYCGCEGLTFTAPVGCEGRPFAYQIDQSPPPPEGVRCDPESEGPVFFDLIVEGSGFGDFDGGIARVKIEDAPEGVGEGSAPISGGSFTVNFDRSFDPDRFGYFVNVYIDTDFDEVCDPGLEPSYGEFASNTFDFEEQRVVVNFSPDSGEIPELCEEW